MNNDGALTQERAITEHVRQAFRANTTTARYPIEVAVQGATVTLHGTVDSQETKDTAEELARSVPGVVNVINGLVIDQDAGQEPAGSAWDPTQKVPWPFRPSLAPPGSPAWDNRGRRL